METAVQSRRWEDIVRTPAVFLLLVLSAFPQRQSNNWPKPPAPAETAMGRSRAPQTQVLRVDPAQLQREAKELQELSESVQPDIEGVSRGLLPKDTIDKLKRIEKLAKHMRGEIAR
jgi:hypothetical protein